jgi:signal transduction histidine kinase
MMRRGRRLTEVVARKRFSPRGVPTYSYVKRLVMAGNVTLGGAAAFAAWRESRTTQKMLRTLAAHQLRTPLSVVVGALHTIDKHRERLSDEKMDELLDMALNETRELDRLIGAFMTLEPNVEGGTTSHPHSERERKQTPIVRLDEPEQESHSATR